MATNDSTPHPDDDIPQQKQYSVDMSLQTFVGNISDRAASVAQALSTPPKPPGNGGATPAPLPAPPDLHPHIPPHPQPLAEPSPKLPAQPDPNPQIHPDPFAKLKQ